MRRILITICAVIALISASAMTASATPPDESGFHQVWVCKYAGQPGDFEFLKPGKNPIIVDVAAADAYIGADFADGQTHSLVIDLATDENTGQGEKYIGTAVCPEVTPSTQPSDSPTSEPSVTPSDEPSAEPSLTAPPSSSPSHVARTSVPSQPNTATGESATVSSPPISWTLLLLASLLSLAMLALNPTKRSR